MTRSFVRAERLTSVFDSDAWHAIYPSASRTLCGIVPERRRRVAGRRYAWTCPDCIEYALAFHEIDGCAADRWLHAIPGRVSAGLTASGTF